MNNYDRRWLFVLNWAKNVKRLINQGYVLHEPEDLFFFEKDEFTIDEDCRLIYLTKLHSRFTIYDGNLEYDHGAYTPILELKKQLQFYQLYKKADIDLFAMEN